MQPDGAPPDDRAEPQSSPPGLQERGVSAAERLLGVLHDSQRELLALRARNRELEDAVGRFSGIDPITGLFNERGLAFEMAREEARARRFGASIAAVALVTDCLPAMAERFGRETAAHAERASAEALRISGRGSDVLARTADGHYVALLLGTTSAGAGAFCARAARALTPVTMPDGSTVRLCFATGIATLDEAGTLAAAVALARTRIAPGPCSGDCPALPNRGPVAGPAVAQPAGRGPAVPISMPEVQRPAPSTPAGAEEPRPIAVAEPSPAATSGPSVPPAAVTADHADAGTAARGLPPADGSAAVADDEDAVPQPARDGRVPISALTFVLAFAVVAAVVVLSAILLQRSGHSTPPVVRPSASVPVSASPATAASPTAGGPARFVVRDTGGSCLPEPGADACDPLRSRLWAGDTAAWQAWIAPGGAALTGAQVQAATVDMRLAAGDPAARIDLAIATGAALPLITTVALVGEGASRTLVGLTVTNRGVAAADLAGVSVEGLARIDGHATLAPGASCLLGDTAVGGVPPCSGAMPLGGGRPVPAGVTVQLLDSRGNALDALRVP